MKALWGKEVRDLWPFLALAVFLLVLDLGDWLTAQFDARSLAMNFEEMGSEMAVMLFLVSFAMGTGLLIREIDDRTLGFLDGLPVSRLRIFGVKVAVAAAVLMLYPVGLLLLQVLQHVVARGSLDQAMHLALLWQKLAMLGVVMSAGLAIGLLLGFLRSLCWLVFALYTLGLHALSLNWSWVGIFDPTELLDFELTGAEWRVPLVGLITQLVMLATCGMLALAIFVNSARSRGSKLHARLNQPLVSALVTLATIGALIALFALLVSAEPDKESVAWEESEFAGAQFAPSPAGSAQTTHYSFSYPANQSGDLQELLGGADAIHAKVASLLGVEAGARIDVDLSGSSINTLGTAFHDRIRMHRDERALATLAHETAHVLARRLAGGELERELSKMQVLNEGLAEWVENQVSRGAGLTDRERLHAAIVSRRQLLRVEQLTDAEALDRDVDVALKYSLGAVLVDSMVERYGPASPRELLRTLGDPDFPRGMAGAELWFAAFQKAGFDLALVFADYAGRARSWETQFADQIAALPRPRGSLLAEDELFGVELRLDTPLPEGWSGVVRFRPDDDSELYEYESGDTDENLIAWVPAEQVVDDRVCFQPGIVGDGVALFEAWVCLPLDSAANR